jgi:hypothetical protein
VPRNSQSFDRPVVERQLGDTPEVAPVAGNEDGTLSQRDCGDLQILRTDPESTGRKIGITPLGSGGRLGS